MKKKDWNLEESHVKGFELLNEISSRLDKLEQKIDKFIKNSRLRE